MFIFIQLSVFATLFVFEKYTKIIHYITAKQAQMLLYYFEMDLLFPYLRILEVHYPKYDEFYWIDPFPK